MTDGRPVVSATAMFGAALAATEAGTGVEAGAVDAGGADVAGADVGADELAVGDGATLVAEAGAEVGAAAASVKAATWLGSAMELRGWAVFKLYLTGPVMFLPSALTMSKSMHPV